MVVQTMKSVIKYVIELDIEYLETFLGYDGDSVLRVSTRHEKVVLLISKYVNNLDLDFKSEYNASNDGFNVYVGVKNTDVFKLKRDKLNP